MFVTVLEALNEGFLETLKLFAVTLMGAIPLGLLIAMGFMNGWAPLRFLDRQGERGGFVGTVAAFRPISALMKTIVWIFRGTPLMLQLIVIFYVPGYILPQNPWAVENGRFWAAAVAFIINYACYFSEIYRGGIQGVPVGQQEAGQVLGMTKSQIFFKVTLLQMVKRIVPPMSNEIITLVKDTAIARMIGWQELIYAGYAFMKGSHGYAGLYWPLLFTGLYYLLFNGFLTILFGWIEKKLSYFRA